MKKVISLLLFSTLFSVVVAFAKDLKSVTFSVPQMVCENCEAKVMKNIRFEKGVKDIKTDVEKKMVTITYDAEKTNPEKLAGGFAKFNYEVTVAVPALDTNKKGE